MLAAVKVAGTPDISGKAKRTLKTLKLTKTNNCMVYPESESTKKALEKIKDIVTFGEVDTDTLKELLVKRGDLEEYLDELDYENVDEVVEALENEELSTRKLRSVGMDVPFRLSPPSKGFSDTKKNYNQSGALGYRGEEINDLLDRMI